MAKLNSPKTLCHVLEAMGPCTSQYILLKLTIYFNQLGLSWALNYLKKNNCYYLWAQKI
jgi:hypothetical protein